MKATLLSLLGRLNGHFLGRVITAAALVLLTLIPYHWINENTAPRFDLMTPLDDAVPFLPWTLPLYQSFYVLILAAAWVCEADEFLRTLLAVLAANFIAYLGFLTLTAHYPRPDPTGIESAWLRAGFEKMFGYDQPGNTFPSLHVTVTWLLTLRMVRRRFGTFWLVWGSLVVLSTLTVKQHFVVDVVGGLAVAWGVNAWLLRDRRPAAAAPDPARTE